MDPAKRKFSYSCTLIKASGSENRPEVECDQPLIIITEGGTAVDVDVRLLGDMAQNKISAVEVDLRCEPLDGQQPKVESHLLEAGKETRFTQRLLLRADRPTRKFEYKTIVYGTAGDPLESEWTPHESALLVLQAARLLESN
jgi:hypothetical protein